LAASELELSSFELVCRVRAAVLEEFKRWGPRLVLKIANDAEKVRRVAALCNLTPGVVASCLRSACNEEVAYESVFEEESGDRVNSGGVGPAAGAVSKEEGEQGADEGFRELLTRALKLLPEDEAKLLAMRYGVNGFRAHTPGELGRLWEMSAVKVGHRLRQVRDALRAAMRENQGALLEGVDEPELQRLLRSAPEGSRRWGAPPGGWHPKGASSAAA
jgi:DNA-directed RNA polymerase specialized sigma24 family protein